MNQTITTKDQTLYQEKFLKKEMEDQREQSLRQIATPGNDPTTKRGYCKKIVSPRYGGKLLGFGKKDRETINLISHNIVSYPTRTVHFSSKSNHRAYGCFITSFICIVL